MSYGTLGGIEGDDQDVGASVAALYRIRVLTLETSPKFTELSMSMAFGECVVGFVPLRVLPILARVDIVSVRLHLMTINCATRR